MTIVGPTHLAGTDDLDLKTRAYYQSFKDTVDRGLESILIRGYRTQNNFSPNMLSDPTWNASPFLSTSVYPWEKFGCTLVGGIYKPIWTANNIAMRSSNAYSPTFAPGNWYGTGQAIRTGVKGFDGKPLQLEAGWVGEVVFQIAGSSDVGARSMKIRAYNSDVSESFTTTISIPTSSVATNYTLNFTTTKQWRGVTIELSANGAITNPVNVKSASFRYKIVTLNGLIKLAVYNDNAGRPGARIAAATTTLNINSGMTGAAANYTFNFPANVFLKAGELYHFGVHVDSTELANWSIGTGADNIVYLKGSIAAGAYADGQMSRYQFGTGFNDAVGAGGDLYFQINYTNTAPASGSYPITVDWDCDCAVQYGRVAKLVTDAEGLLDNYAYGIVRERIEISSSSEPGLGRWQSEWLLRGKSLPIPEGTQLLWYDPDTSKLGGEFYITGGVVSRMETRDLENTNYITMGVFGASYVSLNANAGMDIFSTNGGGSSNAGDWAQDDFFGHAGGALGFVIPYRSKVYITMNIHLYQFSNTEFYFFVDGIPVIFDELGGTTATSDSPAFALTPTGQITVNSSFAVTTILEPGNHYIAFSTIPNVTPQMTVSTLGEVATGRGWVEFVRVP